MLTTFEKWLGYTFLLASTAGILSCTPSRKSRGGGGGSSAPLLTLVCSVESKVVAGERTQVKVFGVSSAQERSEVTETVSYSIEQTGDLARMVPQEHGLVQTAAPGDIIVHVTDGTKLSGSCPITIAAPDAKKLVITPNVTSLAAGEDQKLTALAVLTDGSTSDVTKFVSWSVPAEGLAILRADYLNEKGRVFGISEGKSYIEAKIDGQDVFARQEITVSPAEIVGIVIRPESSSIPAGFQGRLQAFALYSSGMQKDVTALATWSSSKQAVASLPSSGVISGLAAGDTEVSAEFGGRTGKLNMGISNATLTGLQLTVPAVAVPAGLKQPVKVTATFSDQSTLNVTSAVSLSSSDAAVVAIDQTAGVIRGVQVGGSVVRASYQGKEAATALAVTSASLESIEVIRPDGNLPQGLSVSPRALGRYSDKSVYDITSLVGWKVDDETVATFTAGVLSAKQKGKTTYRASFHGVEGSSEIVVIDATLQSMRFEPASLSVAQGFTTAMKLFATYSDGKERDISSGATWKVSDPKVASILGAVTPGLVLPVAVGQSRLTAEFQGQAIQTLVTVTDATLKTLSIKPETLSLDLGKTSVVTVSGTFSDDTTVDLTSAATYQSADAQKAYVYSQAPSFGLVQAISPTSSPVSVTARVRDLTATTSVSVNALTTSSAPSAPLLLVAAGASGRVDLTYSGVFAAETYKIYKSTTSGGESFLTQVSATSFSDTAVTAGQVYYYKVSAVNSSGESPLSSEASATVPAAQSSVATPSFSASPGSYSSSQTVAITTTTSGATIYYTTDGSTPTSSSALYSGAITVNAT